jgi:hypothetical protein
MFAKISAESAWSNLEQVISSYSQKDGSSYDEALEDLEAAVEALPLSFRNRASLWRVLSHCQADETEEMTPEQYDAAQRAEMAKWLAFHMERLEVRALAAGKDRVAPEFDSEQFLDRMGR